MEKKQRIFKNNKDDDTPCKYLDTSVIHLNSSWDDKLNLKNKRMRTRVKTYFSKLEILAIFHLGTNIACMHVM